MWFHRFLSRFTHVTFVLAIDCTPPPSFMYIHLFVEFDLCYSVWQRLVMKCTGLLEAFQNSPFILHVLYCNANITVDGQDINFILWYLLWEPQIDVKDHFQHLVKIHTIFHTWSRTIAHIYAGTIIRVFLSNRAHQIWHPGMLIYHASSHTS